MTTNQIIFRPATIDDAEELLAIYAPYIKETAITFEYEVPSIEEFQERIRKTKEKYPYIVAVLDGKILGYAYTSAMGSRQAYSWSVETSIYLHKEARGHGLGKRMYSMIEQISHDQNVTNLNACIAVPRQENPYLTTNSRDFHEHLGFHFVGEFNQIGYKFDQWFDLVWMEKMVGEHSDKPEPVIPFSKMLADGYQIKEG